MDVGYVLEIHIHCVRAQRIRQWRVQPQLRLRNVLGQRDFSGGQGREIARHLADDEAAGRLG